MENIVKEGILNYNPTCLRKTSNWSKPDAKLRFDNEKFNPDEVLRLMPSHSPKMVALLKQIEALDNRDMQKEGKLFKHFIFSDVKSSAYGPKMIVSSLLAKGWNLGYRPERGRTGKLTLFSEQKLAQTPQKNCLFLSSVDVWGEPISSNLKKEILGTFNKRPTNVHGELVRIIVMDSGYKEGIDLFDIKYVHIFEPSVNASDQKQVIGRGTRTCGQKGLQFNAKNGWPLYVYVYDLSFPPEMRSLFMNSATAIDFYLKANHFDFRMLKFTSELERLTVLGSVDYELNKQVHQFSIPLEDGSPVVGDRQNVYGGAETRSAYRNRGMTLRNGRIYYGDVKEYEKRTRKTRRAPSPKAPSPVKVMDPEEAKGSHDKMALYVRQLAAKLLQEGEVIRWDKVVMENKCGPPPTHGGSRRVERQRGGGTGELMTYTPTQNFVRSYFTPEAPVKGMLLYHSVGTGKCHAKDTPILMYDGSIKLVQDIVVGDSLMGDDSTPRKVLSLAQGQDEMFDVIPSQGDKYTVNSEHILVLKNKENTQEILEVEVKDFVVLADSAKWVGYRSAVSFPRQSLTNLPPYGMGRHCISQKTLLPIEYIINHFMIRRKVLAGCLHDSSDYTITCYSTEQANQLLYLARSLGLGAYTDANNKIQFYGELLNQLPRAGMFPNRAQTFPEDPLLVSIQLKSVGQGDYYGFTLDGNNRYLLGDFTVTHNTCSAIAAATSSFEPAGYTILWVTRHTLKEDIFKNMFYQVCNENIANRIRTEGLKIPDGKDNASKRMALLGKAWRIRPMSYKQFSNLVSKGNDIYHQLVRINGKEDPLRKTLLIIDEAHKLYGGASDLSSIERPNMDQLHTALMNSYALSGQNSVRVLLMTATPITEDPMELIKLINLCRPRQDQIPSDFRRFSKEFLTEEGLFSRGGEQRYLDVIAGYISYLNREKDARVFSQPQIKQILVPIADMETLKALDDPDRSTSVKDLQSMAKNVKTQMETIDKRYKSLSKPYFKNLYSDLIVGSDTKTRKACEKIITANVDLLMKDMIEVRKNVLIELKEEYEAIQARIINKRSFAKKKNGNEIFTDGMYNMFRTKCAVPVSRTAKNRAPSIHSENSPPRRSPSFHSSTQKFYSTKDNRDEALLHNFHDEYDDLEYDDEYHTRQLEKHPDVVRYDKIIEGIEEDIHQTEIDRDMEAGYETNQVRVWQAYLERPYLSDYERAEFQAKIDNFKKNGGLTQELQEKYEEKIRMYEDKIATQLKEKAQRIQVLKHAIVQRLKAEKMEAERLKKAEMQAPAAAPSVRANSMRVSPQMAQPGLPNRNSPTNNPDIAERVEFYRQKIQSEIQETVVQVQGVLEAKAAEKRALEEAKERAKQEKAAEKELKEQAKMQEKMGKNAEKELKEQAKMREKMEKEAAKAAEKELKEQAKMQQKMGKNAEKELKEQAKMREKMEKEAAKAAEKELKEQAKLAKKLTATRKKTGGYRFGNRSLNRFNYKNHTRKW